MLVHIKQRVTSVIHQLVSQQVASLYQQQGGLGVSDIPKMLLERFLEMVKKLEVNLMVVRR